jgi:single-stranded DNA-binding protein
MLSQHLGKGRRIGVDGRLDWSSWESQDGGKRSKVEVIAQSVQFLDSRGDGEGGGGASQGRRMGNAPAGGGDLPVDRSDMQPAKPRPTTTTSPSKAYEAKTCRRSFWMFGGAERGAWVHAQLPAAARHCRGRDPAKTPRCSAARTASRNAGKRLADLLGRTILTSPGRRRRPPAGRSLPPTSPPPSRRRAARATAAIRALGTYSVPIELAPGLTTEVKTIVSR